MSLVVRFVVLVVNLLTAVCALQAQALAVLQGKVVDGAGGRVVGARIAVSGNGPSVETGPEGAFRLDLAPGHHVLRVLAKGFTVTERPVDLPAVGLRGLEIQLAPAPITAQMTVSANLIAGTSEDIARIPGSVNVLDAQTLKEARLFTFDEALRRVPGLHVRSEEGFGLRPNIGIRGLNPTRSSRVLLLEDGLPLAYAPYGDNASYYHPPIDRFDGVEVVKGAGQILYGPMTVGGVVNYVTPSIPDRRGGTVLLSGGNRDYLNGHFRYGGTWNGTGLLFDATRKQGDGARDHTTSELTDLNFKLQTALGERQTLSFKANYYGEDSNVTYSGLRLDEWIANPRQNPFRNDFFDGSRLGLSASHISAWTPAFVTTTNLYYSAFSRDWWRQSSSSAQRPNRAADPTCGGMANLLTTCGNEGRLRDYHSWGVEPRARWFGALLGIRSELDFGVRAHVEIQDRRQVNGLLPLARTGAIVEDNERRTQAYSGFLQNRFLMGKWTLTPGIRLEHVRYQRNNRLFNNGLGVFGRGTVTKPIPGVGLAYTASTRFTIFAGVHRGFAPPRAEDIINNSGGFVELDPELSWNTEFGVRARLAGSASVDATYFRLDYSNQVIPATLAGGVGSTLTSAGRTLNSGVEVAGRYEARLTAGSTLFLRGAWTWLPTARFAGTRFSAVSGFGGVSISGNRLPYAPSQLLQGVAGLRHRRGVNGFLEMVHTGRQFGDDLNSVNPTADGQRGALPGNVVWNATLNVPFEAKRTTAFVTVKNLFDRLVLVDRVRGMLPGSPRLIQAGLRFDF